MENVISSSLNRSETDSSVATEHDCRIMVSINYGKRNNQKGGSRHERLGDHGITVANDDASLLLSLRLFNGRRAGRLFLGGIKRATTGRELKSFSKLAGRSSSRKRGWKNSLTRLQSAGSIKGRRATLCSL